MRRPVALSLVLAPGKSLMGMVKKVAIVVIGRNMMVTSVKTRMIWP